MAHKAHKRDGEGEEVVVYTPLELLPMVRLRGMPACGQAVGCGVCDTPELFSGAAGLCVCARVCWCHRIFTYIHKYLYRPALRYTLHRHGTYALIPQRVARSAELELNTSKESPIPQQSQHPNQKRGGALGYNPRDSIKAARGQA